MAVPKDRTSRSKRDKRRSHHALAMPARSVCPKCKEPKAPHRVCPNCGAPLEINQVGECRYCRAAVTSGRFDWVLSRIEQEDEYTG